MGTKAKTAADADAILQQDIDAKLATAGDNLKGAVDKALAAAEQLGATAANGAASLTDLAVAFTGWVADKVLTRENADKVYLAYANAFNASARNGVAELATDEKGARVSISIFRSFGNPQVVAHGAKFHERVLVLRNEVPAERRMSGYNSMVAVNRGLEKLELKAAYVTDEQIVAMMTKPVTASKDDLAKLAEIIARMEKLSIEGIDGQVTGLKQFHAIAAGLVIKPATLIEGKRMTAEEIKAEIGE
jgi:hypothetical protein